MALHGPPGMISFPGDVASLDSIGMGEGQPIWTRMALIIRNRRLDVRVLMAGFDRNRYGHMYALLSVSTLHPRIDRLDHVIRSNTHSAFACVLSRGLRSV